MPVWRLTLAYALMMAGTPLMVLLAGLIGMDFAPSEGLATLPVALVVVGVAASTLPTGKLLERWGRRRIFLANAWLSVVAALVAGASLAAGSFAGFCAAALMFGWAAAAGHQYRFAALEYVPAADAPRATSLLLLGGILAAFLGPEMAVAGRRLLTVEYAGSFALLLGGYGMGMVLLALSPDRPLKTAQEHAPGRRRRELLRSPVMIVAISAAALGYGVMSLIMTATPISMHRHAGHSLEATKVVIQSHILAMYLPSIAYPWLQRRLGYRGMLWAGTLAFMCCLGVAWIDSALMNYWVALVVLGVGWNFLFLTGTNLLPTVYRPQERFRAQTTNDFLVFSVQATASLGSGWLLFRWRWDGLLWFSVPMLLAFMILLLRWQRHLPRRGSDDP